MNNGRVDNIDEETYNNYIVDERRPLFNNLKEYSLKGIITNDELSNYYFCDYNMNTLQQIIRYRVYEEINEIIDKQSDTELFIIMRSIYLQYGGMSYNNKEELFNIVRTLNNKVINYAVQNIISNFKQYDMYLNDLSRLPVPLEHPEYENDTNTTYDMTNYI